MFNSTAMIVSESTILIEDILFCERERVHETLVVRKVLFIYIYIYTYNIYWFWGDLLRGLDLP